MRSKSRSALRRNRTRFIAASTRLLRSATQERGAKSTRGRLPRPLNAVAETTARPAGLRLDSASLRALPRARGSGRWRGGTGHRGSRRGSRCEGDPAAPYAGIGLDSLRPPQSGSFVSTSLAAPAGARPAACIGRRGRKPEDWLRFGSSREPDRGEIVRPGRSRPECR